MTKLVCISVAIHFQIYFNRPQKLYASVQQSLNLLDRLLQDEVCACHYDLNITNHRIVLVAHMMDIWNSPMVGKLSLPHVNGFCILTFNLQRKKICSLLLSFTDCMLNFVTSYFLWYQICRQFMSFLCLYLFLVLTYFCFKFSLLLYKLWCE